MDEQTEGGADGAAEGSDLHDLSVVGVRVELPSQQPIVLLKEVDGERYLPIWIGAGRPPRSRSPSRASSRRGR